MPNSASGLDGHLLFGRGKTNPNLSAETNRFGLCVLGSPGWTRTSDGVSAVEKSYYILNVN